MLKQLVICLLLPLAAAQAVQFSFADQAVTAPAGSVVQVVLDCDFPAGDTVMAFELELQFPWNWTVSGVQTAGGLVDGWNTDMSVQADGRQLHLAVAADQPMSGSGLLLNVEAVVNGSGWLEFLAASYNEGVVAETQNGYFTHAQPAPLNIQPQSEQSLIIGESLPFSVSGTVDPPVTWSVQDPLTGSVDSEGLFLALGQGSNRVFGLDAQGRTGQGGLIQVHSVELAGGLAEGVAGLPVELPLQLTHPSAAGIMAFELTVNLQSNRLSLAGLETTGTLCAGWTDLFVQQSGNLVTISGAAPPDDLITGSGDLVVLQLDTQLGPALNVYPQLQSALFNESLSARRVQGQVSLAGTGSFSVSPNTALLKRGTTLQMSLVGTPNGEPIDWQSLNPSVATINSDGLLTALSGGAARVGAVDPLGVGDTSDVIQVYDLDLRPGLVPAPVGQLCRLPLVIDSLVGLAVGSWEAELQFDTTWFEFAGIETDSTLSESWSEISWSEVDGQLQVAGAGMSLPEAGTTLFRVLLQVAPGANIGSQSQIRLDHALLNEGHPVLRLQHRWIVFTDPDVSVTEQPAQTPGFHLDAPHPNPFNPVTRIPFTLDRATRASLVVYNLLGEEVQRLEEAALPAGRHARTWNGLDAQGLPVAGGVYLVELRTEDRRAVRRLTYLK